MFDRPAPRRRWRRVEAGAVVGDREAAARRARPASVIVTAAPGACLPAFCSASRQQKYTAASTLGRVAADVRRRRRVTASGLRVGRRPQRLGQPGVAQQRRVDAVGEVAQLLRSCPARASRELVEQLDGGRRVVARGCRAASRRFTASATRCCWAPSCRSRSICRRSASRGRDDPARGTPAAPRCACRRSSRVACSASSSARLRSSIASLPATAASARSSAPVNGGGVRRRVRSPPAPSTRLPSTAGAKRICGGSRASGAPARGSHIRSQPGPATPTRASRPRSAASSGSGTGRVAVERGGDDRRAVQVARRPEGSAPRRASRSVRPTRQLPVAAHRLGQRAQQLGHRLGAAGVLAEVGEQLVGRAAHRVQRGAGPAGGAARRTDRRTRPRRRSPPPRARRPGARRPRQPAEQEQQRDQPEEDRRATAVTAAAATSTPVLDRRACALEPGGDPDGHGEGREHPDRTGGEHPPGTRSRRRARRSRRRRAGRRRAGPGGRGGRAGR